MDSVLKYLLVKREVELNMKNQSEHNILVGTKLQKKIDLGT